MRKRVYIVHGWSGHPGEGWLPWIRKELEGRGFEVSVPAMPDADYPVIEKWVAHLAEAVGEPDENTYFIGHSIGCQAILRYLETLDTKVGGVVFVAGWFILSDLETEEERVIGKPWIETPIDFNKVKATTESFMAIFSEDDPVVPFEANKKLFEERLGPQVIIDNGKGHFSEDDGVMELPSALNAILGMTQ